MTLPLRVFGEQFAGLAALGALGYWWLGWPESNLAQLAVSAFVVAILLAGMVLLAVRARRGLRATNRVMTIVAVAVCLAAAYALVIWVPALTGFRAQAVSVVLRFGAAYLLLVTGWISFWAATSARKTEG
jgi:amino acid transporter